MPCKAAEAAYRGELRKRQAKGLPILGQYISASEAWARIRVLKQEGFTHRKITGWANGRLPLILVTSASRIRLLTLVRLRAQCHRYLIPDADLPNHQRLDL